MKILKNKLLEKIGLQFFAEGTGDGGGAAGEGAAESGNIGADDMFIARMEQKYGITDGVASAQAIDAVKSEGSVANSKKTDLDESENGKEPSAEPNDEKPKSVEEEFDELVKSDKYRGVYGKRVASALADRFKNQTDARAEADRYKATLLKFSHKYGKNADDVDGIIEAIETDDELLEEEALAAGKSVNELRNDKREAAEKAASAAEISRLKSENARLEAEKNAREDARRWSEEAKETVELYPDFKLVNEIKNPDFLKYLRMEGMTVTDAYEHAHMKDIVANNRRTAEKIAEENAAKAVQSGQSRPREGASAARQNINTPRIDVRNMSDSDFERIEEMLARGEPVTRDHLR